MKLSEFYQIRDAEDFFEFFSLEYDEAVIIAKRALIMKSYGDRIKNARSMEIDDEKRLEYYRFSLIAVYKMFEEGDGPSAAEVWDLPEGGGSGCISCKTVSTCKTQKTGCSTGD